LPALCYCIRDSWRLASNRIFLQCPEERFMFKLSSCTAACCIVICIATIIGCQQPATTAAPSVPTYRITGPDTVPGCTIPQEHGRTYLRMVDGPSDSMAAWLTVGPEALVRDALDRNIQVGDIWYPLGNNTCANPMAVTAIIIGLNQIDTTMTKHGFVPIGEYNPYCIRPDQFRRYRFTWN
jgi:hypothetical protein